MILNERLKTLRYNAGYTQKTFAEKIGENQGTYRNWEQGLHQPDTETVVKIANALNCSVDYLLGISDVIEIDPSEHREFASATHEVLYQRLKNSTEERLKRIEKLWDLVDEEFENNP